jgi:hypothetical protein
VARSVLALLLATGLLVGVSFVLGQAIVFLCGWPRWQWWAPALGYGVLLILFGQAIHVPRHQSALLAIAVVAAAAALLLPFVRASLREAAAEGLVVGVGLILLAAIPVFAAGHTGILGASVSNDMSQHLTAAYWLRDSSGVLPVAAIGGDLVKTGYPIGPHALAAGLTRGLGIGEERAFAAVTLAVPALTGFVALGLVPMARRAARWAFAAVIGLGYLLAAYLAQGSFKETILAMIVLATAVALNDLPVGRRVAWRQAIPIGLFAGAAIYTYSYGGVLWLGAVVLFYLGAEVLRRRAVFAPVREWAPAAMGAIAVAALVTLPEVDRVRAFRHSIFGQESLRNHGNLSHSLNPLETLGVWFSGDFRFNPVPRWPTTLFCVIALAALAGGLVWWWRRRSLALPAAVAAALLVWVNLALTVNIYNAAKGLVVLAPLVMACIGAPLAAAWSARSRRSRWSWPVRAVGVVLLGGAVVSSFGVLRSAPVGLGSHEKEFAAIRPLVRHKAVLFLDNDHFAQWELRGARPLYTTNTLYAPAQLPMVAQKRGGPPVDVDNFGGPALDALDYIVVSGARYQSEIPPNFRLVLQTPSYEVFRRTGPTPTREPIEPPSEPGVVLDCGRTPQLANNEWAGVLPRAVVSTAWTGSIARPGGSARMRVTLPRGRWDISIQYLSTTPVTLRAPGLTKHLAPNFGLITTYWPAGTVTSDGRPLTLTLTTAERSWFGQLLGRPRAMRAPLSPRYRPLLHAAFTRHGETPQRVPAKEACGRYVDWLAPEGSSMRGRR